MSLSSSGECSPGTPPWRAGSVWNDPVVRSIVGRVRRRSKRERTLPTMLRTTGSFQTLPARQGGVPGEHSPEEDKLIWDACITFFGVAYAAARLVYRSCGAR